MAGRSIALYGPTGSGKTTLLGELAKHKFKSEGKKTRLNAADRGGYESLKPLIKLGVIVPNFYDFKADPWVWIAKSISAPPNEEIGLEAYDSATSMGEALLTHIANSDLKVGAQNTQKFKVTSGDFSLQVGANNMNHYGVVQTWMLDMIWQSTWITESGSDVDLLWTFGLDQGEDALDVKVAGPKLAGHAMTASIPKWFQYCFRTATHPQQDGPPSHVLYLQEHEENGIMGFGNSRYPLDATTPLPVSIEPASLVEALNLIDQGQDEAETSLREELGL